MQPKNFVHRFPRAAAAPSPETLPHRGFLGRLAGDVAEMLRVERVTVAIADPDHADTGIVAACLGAPGMLGMHLPLPAERATGVKSAAEAAALGLGEDGEDERPWSFAHVPFAGAGDDLMGAVTVVSRRVRAFTEQDLDTAEKLARRRVPEFDRRRGGRTPQATA